MKTKVYCLWLGSLFCGIASASEAPPEFLMQFRYGTTGNDIACVNCLPGVDDERTASFVGFDAVWTAGESVGYSVGVFSYTDVLSSETVGCAPNPCEYQDPDVKIGVSGMVRAWGRGREYRPYVAAGVLWAQTRTDKSLLGPAISLGLLRQMTERWGVGFEIEKAWLGKNSSHLAATVIVAFTF